MALLLEDEEQEIINFKTAVFQYKCDNFYHPEADGVSFRKPTRPSLPLRKAPPLTPTLSPSGEREETALRCSEPLRSKVGGPSKVFAMVLRDGTAWRGKFKVNSL